MENPQAEIERLTAEIERLTAEKRRLDLEQQGKKWRGIKTRSHTEHGAMGNPHPVQSEEFVRNRSQLGIYWGELDSKVFGVKVPSDVREFLDKMDKKERAAAMRSLIVIWAREILETKESLATEHGATPDNLEALAIGDRFVVGDGSVWEVWEDGESDRLYRLLLLGNKGEETEGEEE